MTGKENELKERVQHYRKLTETALNKVRLMEELSEKEQRTANDFMEMARNYFSDAGFFEQKGELLLALAAYSYAHAWLDAGVRARLFNAFGDDRLFTVP
ncbi:MAG: DUF357 domain-containing protein [Candidatus Diapherotrites archaeon]|nr:DUF357 domain-containing protein [Candidatus Diapherotrites archaeon]